MPEIEINLISGRTIDQGVSMENGKEKLAYRNACGIIELDDVEFKKLGTYRNTNVRVTSEYGSVVVKAIQATQGPHPGQMQLLTQTHTLPVCLPLRAHQ